jgi:hypothetical protein
MSVEKEIIQSDIANTNLFMDVVADQEASATAEESSDEPTDDEASDPDEEADSEDPLEDEEEEGEEEDDEDEVEEDEEEEGEAPEREASSDAPKKHRVTLDDGSQIELLDNATIKMKVNGQFKRVSVKDLRDSYNGGVKHDEMIRRSAEAEKKAEDRIAKADAEDARIVERAKELSGAMTKGNILEAIAVIAELADEDPNQAIDNWTKGMGDFLTEFTQLSPEQRQSKINNFRTAQEVRKLERRRDKLKNSEQKREVNQAIDRACEEQDLSREEFDDAFNSLMKRNEQVREQGGEPHDFGIKHVIDLAVDYRIYENVLNACEDLEVNLEEKDHNYLIKVVRADENRTGTRLPSGDYVQLIQEYAQVEAKTLSRKVGTKKAKTTPKSRKKSKTKEISRMSQIWE